MSILRVPTSAITRDALVGLLRECRQGRGRDYMMVVIGDDYYIDVDCGDVLSDVRHELGRRSIASQVVDGLPDGKRFAARTPYVLRVAASGLPRETLRKALLACRLGRGNPAQLTRQPVGDYHYAEIDNTDVLDAVQEVLRRLGVRHSVVGALPNGMRFPRPGDQPRRTTPTRPVQVRIWPDGTRRWTGDQRVDQAISTCLTKLFQPGIL